MGKFKVREVSQEELEQAKEAEVDKVEDETAEKAAEEGVKLSEIDNCPTCGTPATGSSIQIKVPVPTEGGTFIIGLPLLACCRCGSVFIPASIMYRIMNPPEKSRIITPNNEADIVVPQPIVRP